MNFEINCELAQCQDSCLCAEDKIKSTTTIVVSPVACGKALPLDIVVSGKLEYCGEELTTFELVKEETTGNYEYQCIDTSCIQPGTTVTLIVSATSSEGTAYCQKQVVV